MKMYKGFDKNMQCKGFQFEVGKTYTENRAELCSTGFHACENPFDVWSYYDVVDSRFAEVELDEISKERHNDSKRCGKKIKINAEIGISGMVKAAVNMIIDSVEKCKDKPTSDNGGYSAQIGNSGDLAQIGSCGYSAKIGSCGYSAKIGSSGYSAQIGNSGDLAQIGSCGYSAQIGNSGDYAKISSCGNCAQIGSCGNNAKIGSSGDYALIGSCGYGAKVGSCGDDAVIAAIGATSTAKAKKGSWITLAEYDKSRKPICVKTEQVDGEKIKENVYYKLINGEFTEAE